MYVLGYYNGSGLRCPLLKGPPACVDRVVKREGVKMTIEKRRGVRLGDCYYWGTVGQDMLISAEGVLLCYL